MLKAESARIRTEEEVQIAEQNRDRQVIVARKNKERTDAVESERIEKDRLLEVTERERVVGTGRHRKRQGDRSRETEHPGSHSRACGGRAVGGGRAGADQGYGAVRRRGSTETRPGDQGRNDGPGGAGQGRSKRPKRPSRPPNCVPSRS